MKPLHSLLSFFLTISLCPQGYCEKVAIGQKMAELKIKNGRVYSQVVIRKIEPYGIRILHESGSALIPPEQVPQYRELFGSDDEIQEARQKMVKEGDNLSRSQAITPPQVKPPVNPQPDAAPVPVRSDETVPQENQNLPSAIKLYARTIAMNRKEFETTNWWVGGSPMEEEFTYQHTKGVFRHRIIGADLTNKGKNPDLVLEVFWLGRPFKEKNRTVISQYAAAPVNVLPGATSKFQIASNFNTVDSTLIYLKKEPYGSDYWNGFYVHTWSGYEYIGWVARVSDGKGKVVAIQGARPPMVEFVQEFPPPKIEQ